MNPDGYRQKAKRYSDLAVAVSDETKRKFLVQIACRWQSLAEQGELDPYGDEPRVRLP
jgi:hypothetical protein